MRGEISAFIASATFERPDPDGAGAGGAAAVDRAGHLRTLRHQADLSDLKSVLESGLIYDAVAFSVRLAALGPHDAAGNPVRPTDAGAAWVRGEAGAGRIGATLNPGHARVVGARGVTVSFDAAFDVGPAGAGKTYDLYLLITPNSGTPAYNAAAAAVERPRGRVEHGI